MVCENAILSPPKLPKFNELRKEVEYATTGSVDTCIYIRSAITVMIMCQIFNVFHLCLEAKACISLKMKVALYTFNRSS